MYKLNCQQFIDSEQDVIFWTGTWCPRWPKSHKACFYHRWYSSYCRLVVYPNSLEFTKPTKFVKKCYVKYTMQLHTVLWPDGQCNVFSLRYMTLHILFSQYLQILQSKVVSNANRIPRFCHCRISAFFEIWKWKMVKIKIGILQRLC